MKAIIAFSAFFSILLFCGLSGMEDGSNALIAQDNQTNPIDSLALVQKAENIINKYGKNFGYTLKYALAKDLNIDLISIYVNKGRSFDLTIFTVPLEKDAHTLNLIQDMLAKEIGKQEVSDFLTEIYRQKKFSTQKQDQQVFLYDKTELTLQSKLFPPLLKGRIKIEHPVSQIQKEHKSPIDNLRKSIRGFRNKD